MKSDADKIDPSSKSVEIMVAIGIDEKKIFPYGA